MPKGQKKVLTDVERAKKEQVKRDAFIRVVTPRVNKALKVIRLIGLCASSNYRWTDDQRHVIFSALYEAVEQAESRYEGKKDNRTEFVLPS